MGIGGLIGVLHLPALPSDPRYAGGGFAAVEEHALRDAETLAGEGGDGLLVENYGSLPFARGGSRLPPHSVAAMAMIGRRCKERTGLAVGINCLRNDAHSAVGIAAAAGLDFVRVNVHVGVYVSDQGILEGDAHRTLRYRKSLEAASVQIAADVFVKHARPLGGHDIAAAARDTVERGLADALIVTGTATGAPVDSDDLQRVLAVSGSTLVLIGSGMDPEAAERTVPLVDGAIVGTWLRGGGLDRPIEAGRVRELVAAVRGRFRQMD